VDKGDLGDVGAAIVVTVIMVVGVNVLFWQPLMAYAEKFRVETAGRRHRVRGRDRDRDLVGIYLAAVPG
jgi:NitT/TauT family transport system permease protein